MFDYVAVALAGALVLAVLCALFGDDKRARRGLAVLRVLWGGRRGNKGGRSNNKGKG